MVESAMPVPIDKVDEGVKSHRRCWDAEGIFGDGSCEQLAELGHCRNCPIYIREGRRLFDRAPPSGFSEQWTQRLSQPKEGAPEVLYSILVFRLKAEWYAVKTMLLQEISHMLPIQFVPNRSGRSLAGLINAHGELVPCMKLDSMLGVTEAEGTDEESGRRMIIVGSGAADRFAFPVDEIFGVVAVEPQMVSAAPASVARSRHTFVVEMVQVDDGPGLAGLLDGGRLVVAVEQILASGEGGAL